MPDDQCDDKPSSSMSCNEMPCYTWRVEYPCASCEGKDFGLFFGVRNGRGGCDDDDVVASSLINVILAP